MDADWVASRIGAAEIAVVFLATPATRTQVRFAIEFLRPDLLRVRAPEIGPVPVSRGTFAGFRAALSQDLHSLEKRFNLFRVLYRIPPGPEFRAGPLVEGLLALFDFRRLIVEGEIESKLRPQLSKPLHRPFPPPIVQRLTPRDL